MKKRILSFTLLLVLAISLGGCGKKEIPLSSTPASHVAIQHLGIDLTVTNQEDIAQLTDVVGSLQTKETQPNQSDIQTPIYSFTMYDNDTPTDAVVLFSQSLLQSNNLYYSGDFENLFNCLESIVYASNQQELSELFHLTAKDIAEISIHHHDSKNYKIITDEKEIDKVLKSIAGIQPLSNNSLGSTSRQFSLYYRTKDQTEYKPLLICNTANNKNQAFVSESKLMFIQTPVDLTDLFNQLSANQMPFNE